MKTRQKFATEIATPLCDIFYSSIIESVVADLWKRDITVTVPKTNPPDSPSDPRSMSYSVQIT